MNLTSLSAISPIDGRYAEKTVRLREIFSEYGLMRYRVLAEIRWLQTLAHNAEIPEVPALSASSQEKLEKIAASFTPDEAQRVTAIGDTPTHTVTAIQYYIQ